jgi:osmotically-inducible protein OsmY
MKKYLIVFVLGIVFGTTGYWIFRDGPLATKLRENVLVQKVSEHVDERATSRLKEEMEKEGKIVMNKRAGSSIPKLDDGRLSDLVKAKIAAEPMLADASIREDVKDGEVSLQGSAASYEQVARAMRLALECDATKTVVSTIQVKSK